MWPPRPGPIRPKLLAAAAIAKASSGDAALIAHLRLEIARLGRTLYGQRSERTQRLIDQYELQLEELEASATADALAAEKAASKAAMPAPAARRKPSRQPFPAHLPRLRLVVPGPTACPCCGEDAPVEDWARTSPRRSKWCRAAGP